MNSLVRAILGAMLALASIASAVAQSSYSSVGGATVPLVIQGCLDAQGRAVPQNQSGACPGGSAGSSVTAKPTNSTGAYSAVTVTNSSTQAIAAGVATVILDIKNESTTATIACAFGATAGINTAGSYTIPPGWHRSWEGSFVPAEAVNCISSAATSPATIGAK